MIVRVRHDAVRCSAKAVDQARHRAVVANRVGLRSLRQAGPSLAALALEVHQQDDDELRRAYRRALVDPLRDALIDAVERGHAAGVFRLGVDARVTADALIGAALYRLVILREPAGEEDLDALLDVVLEGLRVG